MSSVTRGNVFEDPGFPPEETGRLPLQVFPSEQIRTLIERHNMKQEEAADISGVQQPKINKITKDDLQGMSIDYLVRLLAQTGGRFQYSLRQPGRMSKRQLSNRLSFRQTAPPRNRPQVSD